MATRKKDPLTGRDIIPDFPVQPMPTGTIRPPSQTEVIPEQKPVPLPKFFGAEGNRAVQVTQGEGGSVFLERLKPSQQVGLNIPSQFGLSAEQQAIENQNIAARNQLATQQLRAQIGQITPEQQAAADAQNNMGSLTQGIIPEVLSSVGSKAATGAAIGATAGLATGGTLSLPAAGVGAIGGAVYGAATILSHLKEEAIQNTKVQKISASKAQTNIKAIIDGVNKGLVDPVDAVDLYNREIAKIDRAERNLKLLEEKDWLSKAKDELIAIQTFNDVGRAQSAALLNAAIIRPNPAQNYDLPIIQLDAEDLVT